jgi:hypothetical protein
MEHQMRILCVLILSTLFTPRLEGAILLTLDSPAQVGFPGDNLSFMGKILNTGPETFYLNGTGFDVGTPFLFLDDSPIYIDGPTSLLAGEAYLGLLFTAGIDPTAWAGVYPASFTLYGGSEAFAYEPVATAEFSVDVVPEPQTSALVALSLLAVALMKRGRASRH